MHFRIAFAVLVLGRTWCVSNRRIDHSTLVKQQPTIPHRAIDDLQNSARQLMFFHQAAEVKDRGFIGNSIQIQACGLTQNRRFIERLIHRRITVAEPVLHQRNAQHGHQRIPRTADFALWIVRLDQTKQALPGRDLNHLDQEALVAGLLMYAGVLGIGERHLFHRDSIIVFGSGGYLTKCEIFFSVSPAIQKVNI